MMTRKQLLFFGFVLILMALIFLGKMVWLLFAMVPVLSPLQRQQRVKDMEFYKYKALEQIDVLRMELRDIFLHPGQVHFLNLANRMFIAVNLNRFEEASSLGKQLLEIFKDKDIRLEKVSLPDIISQIESAQKAQAEIQHSMMARGGKK